jgi:hypothetical protein
MGIVANRWQDDISSNMAPKYAQGCASQRRSWCFNWRAQNEDKLHSIGTVEMLAATAAEGFTSRSLIVKAGDLNAS